ncbi:tetratricopeptide repeat protein [Chryseobacterium sp.]|uniref:tetratricopeptide repeat protein n=3 Tax=Chryseobacterium sp. TaxID=1871047 RepID=UPI002FC621C3
MIRILLFILIITLISCNPDSKEYEKNFDVPLMKMNEEFRLAGEYDSLVNLNKRFYRKAENMGYEDGKALCYINLAEVNISLENYQKSQSFFNDADAILKHSKNKIHQSRFYNVYGRFNLEMRRLDKAFEYNNEALNLIIKSGNSKLKNNILFNIYLRQGTYLIEKKQYTKALEYFQKARKLDHSGLADCAIGDYIYMHKNMDSAYKYVTIAYNKANASGKKDGVALYANTIMGEYYLADKQYDKAEEALKKALEIDNKTKRIYAYYTKYIYNDLRSVYENKKDNEKAYFYLNAYTEAKNRNNTAILKTINKDMESFIAETKNDSENHRRNIQWVILLSLAVFSLLAVYAWRIISLLRKRKDTLRIESEELKSRMNDKSQAEVMELGRRNDPEFLTQFKEAYPELINKLLHINPNLEDSELAFCAMLKLHFTSKEIASYTLIQHRTVQQKKYRIRKRLNIPTETDIYQFFDDLN